MLMTNEKLFLIGIRLMEYVLIEYKICDLSRLHMVKMRMLKWIWWVTRMNRIGNDYSIESMKIGQDIP